MTGSDFARSIAAHLSARSQDQPMPRVRPGARYSPRYRAKPKAQPKTKPPKQERKELDAAWSLVVKVWADRIWDSKMAGNGQGGTMMMATKTSTVHLEDVDDLLVWLDGHAKKARGKRKAKLVQLAEATRAVSVRRDNLWADLQTIAAKGLPLTERAARRK